MKHLKEQVKRVLMECPESRNSDITLTIEIWKRFFPEKTIGGECSAIRFKELYDLPREDNVKRIRAKFCEQGHAWAFPTEWKIAKGRGMNEDRWRQALGYPKLEDTIYPTRKESYPNKVTMDHTIRAEISPKKEMFEEKTTKLF